jgi:hypothetical protein
LAQRLDSPPWQCSSSNGSVKLFLVQKPITEMEHAHPSPDLTPNYLWLFPKIKSVWKVWRFQDVDIKKRSISVTGSSSTTELPKMCPTVVALLG